MADFVVGKIDFNNDKQHLSKYRSDLEKHSQRQNCIPEELPIEPVRVFESGAKRSIKMPRYDLIPRDVLECLADRLKLGAGKYGEWNWQKGLDDDEFLRDTLNHIQGHLSNIMGGDFSEDDEWGNLGGILFGCMVRVAALRRKA